MKSFALIVWLLLGDGNQQVIFTDHLDDQSACSAAARVVAEKYEARGQRVRYLCHEVVPEVGDVDENGNPIKPEQAAR